MKLITFYVDEVNLYTLVFEISDDNLAMIRRYRHILLGLDGVQELGISWENPEIFEGLAPWSTLMGGEVDEDPLRVRNTVLHMTRTNLWFFVQGKRAGITEWGMSWEEIDALEEGSLPGTYITYSLGESYGDDIFDGDAAVPEYWEIQWRDGQWIAHDTNGIAYSRPFNTPEEALAFAIYNSASEEVEDSLVSDGILEEGMGLLD